MNFRNFYNNPRNFALQLIEEGHASQEDLFIACLRFLSHDEVREMLDNNKLSPRFLDECEEEEDDEDDMYLLYNELYALFYAD